MAEGPKVKSEHVNEVKDNLRVVPPSEPNMSDEQDYAAAATRRDRGKRIALSTVAFAAALIAGYVVLNDFYLKGDIVETENAYLKTEVTPLAPRISGYIRHIMVSDNEYVKEGQILARLDDRDLQIALRQTAADVQAAEAAIGNVEAQVALQRSLVDQAEAALNLSRATQRFAAADADRSRKLGLTGVATQSRVEQTLSVKDQADAAVKRDEANVAATRSKIPVLETQKNQAIAQRDRISSQHAQARLNLSYAELRAPVSGTVGARTLRLGQFVSAGMQLLAIVPLDGLYVVANLKETQLKDIHAGQPVTIQVDSFPGVEVVGQVESISPGSGSEFTLLPADNATGNFTKIIQRIPVRITLDPGELSGHLRSGMSVKTRIATSAP